ncbi:MAG: transcriptional regulator, partial [Verrucomicrobiota bacterium]
DRERNQFVVTLFFHHFLSPDDWVWLRKLEVELNDEEARALVFVREAGAINNAAYRDINRVDVLNASTHLRRLRDNGLLNQKGKGADTYYLPTEKFLAPLRPTAPAATGAQPIQPPPQSGMLSAQSGKLAAQPSNLPAQPSNLPAQPSNLPAQPSNLGLQTELLKSLPEHLSRRVSGLSGKADREAVAALIVDLCVWQPLAADQIATILGRNPVYLRTSFLVPLVRSKRLRHTIPEQPNHPQQKYRAAERKEATA